MRPRILRGELEEGPGDARVPEFAMDAHDRHATKNRLHAASLALGLLQKQISVGRYEDAERTLANALESFSEIERHLAGSASVAVETPGGGSKTGRRALLVEDNDNERELLAGYLRLCGYHVDGVPDGQAALDFLQHGERPDFILLDMQMPRMNGPDTIRAIRKKARPARYQADCGQRNGSRFDGYHGRQTGS